MEKNKRLTKRRETPLAMSMWGGSIKDLRVYNRLAEYEDDEEDGKIIRLPCKVGDTVYIDEKSWRHFIYYKHEFIGSKFFVVGKITSIRITERQIFIRIKAEYRVSYYRYSNYPISAIGKTVFFTREEAKKRLKELQNE